MTDLIWAFKPASNLAIAFKEASTSSLVEVCAELDGSLEFESFAK